ncbi:hypothetical protein [Myroides sp. NP-2]|uniref:hypothetical protein n=1 Tax=Myroides sp. NP-2 TaxID=2759945 RepID=UPI0015FA44B4|nr:hypothetical protein [Myroides sp. NP-2]
MQDLCRSLNFAFFCDRLRFVIGLLLLCCLPFSLHAQTQGDQIQVFTTGTTIDSVRIANPSQGEVFLEIKSYFEEYSAQKPGSIIEFYWLGQQKNGDINVRYVFTNAIIDFHMETSMCYANNEKQTLELNVGRRRPLLLQLMLGVKEGILHVDLL